MTELSNTYHLMRHGQSIPNKERFIVSHLANGTLEEYGLTPVGYEQAEESARASGLGPETLVVVSPFSRTYQTGETARDTIGAEDFVVDVRLRERSFGDLELQSSGNYKKVWERDARSATHTQWGVESLCSVAAREFSLLADLEKEHTGRDILLVGHADPLNILRAGFARRSLRSHRKAFSIGNAEIQPLAVN